MDKEQIIFATAGTVHGIKSITGSSVFSLDPCYPYRLDFSQQGGKLYTLLVREGLVFDQIILPDNCVGMLDSAVRFSCKSKNLSEGMCVRLHIAAKELVRYMALPKGSTSAIEVESV